MTDQQELKLQPTPLESAHERINLLIARIAQLENYLGLRKLPEDMALYEFRQITADSKRPDNMPRTKQQRAHGKERAQRLQINTGG